MSWEGMWKEEITEDEKRKWASVEEAFREAKMGEPEMGRLLYRIWELIGRFNSSTEPTAGLGVILRTVDMLKPIFQPAPEELQRREIAKLIHKHQKELAEKIDEIHRLRAELAESKR